MKKKQTIHTTTVCGGSSLWFFIHIIFIKVTKCVQSPTQNASNEWIHSKFRTKAKYETWSNEIQLWKMKKILAGWIFRRLIFVHVFEKLFQIRICDCGGIFHLIKPHTLAHFQYKFFFLISLGSSIHPFKNISKWCLNSLIHKVFLHCYKVNSIHTRTH